MIVGRLWRKQRYRHRLDAGVVVVPVEATFDVIGMPIDLG